VGGGGEGVLRLEPDEQKGLEPSFLSVILLNVRRYLQEKNAVLCGCFSNDVRKNITSCVNIPISF
jgi:hypothetical protein